jgi:N-carbamoyl-L-amino-acid hydrolase
LITIDSARLWDRLETLAAITDPGRPWTRRSFTPLFLAGRAWLAEQFEQAGLAPHIDAGGNLVGRLAGSDPTLAPLVSGSHSDTVPSGGRYDGILGVLAALEVAHTLRQSGQTLRHDLHVVDFLAEEPSEFGLSCVGSRAWAGVIDDAALNLKRPDGTSLREALAYVGGRPEALASAARPAGATAAYVELHIEQGPQLEAENIEIGVVTAIAAIRRMRFFVQGRADHAGTTPMAMRADALVGTAAIIEMVYRSALAKTTPRRPLVATAGRIENVWPNVANAVPAGAELTIECRAGANEDVIAFCDDIVRRASAALADLNLHLRTEVVSDVAATPCAPFIQAAVEAAAGQSGLACRHLPSGAGHDGTFVSHTGPIGMIFVPCLGGRSHTPEESITAVQAAQGAQVLLDTLLALDRTL